MDHCYVYYKLPAAELAALLPRLRALLAAVAAASGVRPRLQTRSEAAGGLATVMEVYPDIAAREAFDAALAAAVAAQLPPALIAARRVERFRDL